MIQKLVHFVIVLVFIANQALPLGLAETMPADAYQEGTTTPTVGTEGETPPTTTQTTTPSTTSSLADMDNTTLSEPTKEGDEIAPVEDPTQPDSDGDGISDFVEQAEKGTLPDGTKIHYIYDKNGDGMIDDRDFKDTNGDGTPDYKDIDSDGDSIADKIEGPDDKDGDGVPNFQDTDSDGDGISDWLEDHNGLVDLIDRIRGKSLDSDGDGTPDYLDSDSDNDGIPDKDEYVPNPKAKAGPGSNDVDGDGIPNYLDDDSDGDSIKDKDEYVPNPKAKAGPGSNDFDGDGIPNYQDTDSDGDGEPDRKDSRPLDPFVL